MSHEKEYRILRNVKNYGVEYFVPQFLLIDFFSKGEKYKDFLDGYGCPREFESRDEAISFLREHCLNLIKQSSEEYFSVKSLIGESSNV